MADASLIGTQLGRTTFPVDRSKVREFALSLGDRDPIYQDVAAARAELTAHLRRHARDLGRDVHATMSDPLGHWTLVVTPQGAITTAIGWLA